MKYTNPWYWCHVWDFSPTWFDVTVQLSPLGWTFGIGYLPHQLMIAFGPLIVRFSKHEPVCCVDRKADSNGR